MYFWIACALLANVSIGTVVCEAYTISDWEYWVAFVAVHSLTVGAGLAAIFWHAGS